MCILFAILKLMLRLPNGTVRYRIGINILTEPLTTGGAEVVIQLNVFPLLRLGV